MATNAAEANAWGQPKGKGQVILKADRMTAVDGFDPDGRLAPLPAERIDTTLGVYADYGITDQLTFQMKGDWQSGEDAFVDYEGRGPVEIGVTWRVIRAERTAVSLYAGYADGGEGRNAGYAPPGEGDSDWEVRAAVGQSIGETRWSPETFVELQAARRLRAGLPDETRLDATIGVRVRKDWMLLGQVFAGRTDGPGAQWVSVEASLVRDLGDWSLQAGWRQAILGRETPRAGGPVLAIWRRF